MFIVQLNFRHGIWIIEGKMEKELTLEARLARGKESASTFLTKRQNIRGLKEQEGGNPVCLSKLIEVLPFILEISIIKEYWKFFVLAESIEFPGGLEGFLHSPGSKLDLGIKLAVRFKRMRPIFLLSLIFHQINNFFSFLWTWGVYDLREKRKERRMAGAPD